MAKHRKTRKEKVRSDYRATHMVTRTTEEPTTSEEIVSSPQYSFSPKQTSKVLPTSPTPHNAEYNYLSRDLRRIAIVTGSIVVAQVALFFFLTY